MASNGIHIACTYMTRCFTPGLESRARSGYGSIDVGAISGSNLRQMFTYCWIDAFDILATGGLHPLIIDEQAERCMFLNPCQSCSSAFRCTPILQRSESLHN